MLLITILVCFVVVSLAEIIAYVSALNQEKKEEQAVEKERAEKQALEIAEEQKMFKKNAEHEARIESLYDEDTAEYFRTRIIEDLDDTIFEDVLGDDYSCEAELEAYFKDGILWIECRMPNKDEVSRIKDVYYLKSGEEREKLWSDRDFPKVYDGYLYSLCLHIIDDAFNRDRDRRVQSILFNGYLFDYAPTTGQLEKRIIMSVLIGREQWQEIDIEHVDPKACFKHLKGVSAAKLIDVSPITPVLELNKDDRRFIESKDVSTNDGMNLAAMDWEDFEHLVRGIFELEFGKNGGEVRVTQASRDGGVDAIIFDPDPIRGGKIVVQAKRYTNTVPVSAVRDLYGTIVSEGANSGILITTSDYGSDSYEWANGKPIKLLNSGHLLGLLQKHGLKGYINIEEAKKALSE